MPGPFDFKGQKIQDTYGRVVQIATGSLYDGKGTIINADIQAIADASDQRQSESIELSAISSSVFELQQFSSSLDADFATDAELSALSSSILVTTNDLSSSIQDNENELSNQDGRITSLTAATSSYVVFPYTGSAIITGSLEVTGSTNLLGNINLTGDVVGTGRLQISQPNGSVVVGSSYNSTAGNQGSVVAIGPSAMNNYSTTSALRNVAIGDGAMRFGNGAYNTVIGASAGYSNKTRSAVTLVGHAAGQSQGGSGHISVGTKAGRNASDGDYNIYIGWFSGYETKGAYNSHIGYEAGVYASGSKNVVLGYQAGYNLTGSNQLIIANNSSSALITGDFANNTLDISGSVSASTYYGDGSNLTGIETDPFPYTGSAVISGSLDVIGDTNITGSIILQNNSANKIIFNNTDYNYLNTRIKIPNYNTGISLTSNNEIHLIGDNIGVIGIKGLSTPEIRLKSNAIFGFTNANINGSIAVNLSKLNSTTIQIGTSTLPNANGSLLLTNITASGHVSASTYYGDGSNLTGISTTPFPYIGSAIITGSLTVSGSVVDFTSASAVNLNIDSLPLINPIVEYLDVTSSIASGTTLTLPNNLSYISSSTYEYLEIFMNGLRTRYNIDFVPMSNTTIQTQIAFPSGSELTFKSLKR